MAADNNDVNMNFDQQLVTSAALPEEQLSMPTRTSAGLWNNPWATWDKPGVMKVIKWQALKTVAPMPSTAVLDQCLPVLAPDWERIKAPPAGEIQVTWMGHASFLVQMDGLNILTDPVWSDRCSPVSFLGPKRYRKPPCTLMELPRIDVVLISHNHYDHLDLYTVRELKKSARVLWIVPEGHKEWFESESIDRVIEMKWWDTYPLKQEEGQPPSVTIGCLPAQHWSKRTAFDDMHALWSGWGIFGSKKLFFAGDTGFCDGFAEIGRKFGPFDLSLIPIGAYDPRWMMRCQHVDPIEAVTMHQQLGSKQSIGMHWGTWVLTDEHVLEPPQILALELARRALSPTSFIAVTHGQTFDTGTGTSRCPPINYADGTIFTAAELQASHQKLVRLAEENRPGMHPAAAPTHTHNHPHTHEHQQIRATSSNAPTAPAASSSAPSNAQSDATQSDAPRPARVAQEPRDLRE